MCRTFHRPLYVPSVCNAVYTSLSAHSGSVLHCPKAECDMQKRAKRAKCVHFSGQFSRCCLWGQKRPRPVGRLMDAADTFPSNCPCVCRINDSIIDANVVCEPGSAQDAQRSRLFVNKSSSSASCLIRSHYSGSDLRPLARCAGSLPLILICHTCWAVNTPSLGPSIIICIFF